MLIAGTENVNMIANKMKKKNEEVLHRDWLFDDIFL